MISEVFQRRLRDLSVRSLRMSKVSCKFHPEAVLIEDYRAGDQICSECGLVVGDRVIDVGSEWRTFSNDNGGEDRSRVGGPENSLLGSCDLSTMIGPGKMSGGMTSGRLPTSPGWLTSPSGRATS